MNHGCQKLAGAAQEPARLESNCADMERLDFMWRERITQQILIVLAADRISVRKCQSCGKNWVNPSHRFATVFATDMHVWATVGLRLRLGQHHKSLFDKHKRFLEKHLQTR